jgi:protein phosphatase PTC6
MNTSGSRAVSLVWAPSRSRLHWLQRQTLAAVPLCQTCRAASSVGIAASIAHTSNASLRQGRGSEATINHRLTSRGYKDYIRAQYADPSGQSSQEKSRSARIPLKNGSVYGLSATRGIRENQEDASSIVCVELPSAELKAGLVQSRSKIAQQIGESWDAQKAGGEELAGQVLWVGCFDG